jgi:protein gp37
MSGDTNISWTDKVWNPVVGCTRVSRGCDHCYAFQVHDQRHIAWKRGRFPNAPEQYHQPFSQVQLMPDRLEDPLRWRKPARVFVNSMSDLFHPSVPFSFIAQVWATMALAPQHTFQVLTKRPERVAGFLKATALYSVVLDMANEIRLRRPKLGDIPISNPARFPLPNVWIGTSVEDQAAADERIPHLMRVPAAVRFLSCEPLLGPVDVWAPIQAAERDGVELVSWTRENPHYVNWVIAGGESGRHHREMNLEWARSLRDQCVDAGVPFFFKQGSGLRPGMHRELDGRTWEEFPWVGR